MSAGPGHPLPPLLLATPLVETPHPPMVGHVLHVTPCGLRGRAGEAGEERNGWEDQPMLQPSKIKHFLNQSGNGEVV